MNRIVSSPSAEWAELLPCCSWDTAEAREQRASPSIFMYNLCSQATLWHALSLSVQLVPIGFKSKLVSKGSDAICIPRASVQTLCSPPGAQQTLAFVCSLVAFLRECEILLNLTMTSLFVKASAGFG